MRCTNNALYLVYNIYWNIWYIAFNESYYFLCVKKTIELIYQKLYLLMQKIIVMAFLRVQNVLYYNYRLNLGKN